MKSPDEKLKAAIYTYFLAIASVAIHFMVTNNLEYHRDELLYFSLGLHPSAGYATVPPMIGWIAWLMQNIFGYSIYAVRIFPALLSGLMVILISEITGELGGKTYARILACTGFIISGFALRTYILFQPVHIDLFFWTLTIYVIIRYINTSSSRFLFLLGVIAGVALLNKYLIALLFISLFAIIPFTDYRKVFTEKKFWLGILAGFVIFLPNLTWQFLHGLPVISHLSELERTQLVNVDRKGFMIDQLLMPSLATFFTIAGLIYLFINKSATKYRFLGITAILTVLILFILRGKSYYTQGIFPFLIAAGAVSYEKLLKNIWSRILLPVLLVVFTLPIVPFSLPVYKADSLVRYFSRLEKEKGIVIGRRFEDGSIHSLPQDYADMLGWEELTSIANKAYQMVPDKKSCFIYCENYGQAGAITIIGKKYGLPEAISFHESFLYWIPKQFNPDISSFIYINDELGEDVNKLFRKITNVGSISNRDAREFGTTVYLCEDPVLSFNKFWAERLKQLDEEQ
jgi:hypothetical protein